MQAWYDNRVLERWECSVEEHRNGTIRHGVQAGTGDSVAINNSPMVSYRNAEQNWL